MNDHTNGTMAFILHAASSASFSGHQHARFPTVRGSWFNVDVETLIDGTAQVTMVGADERTYHLRGRIPSCGNRLRVRVTWTRDYVALHFEGHEVARVKTEERAQP
jgi:hypothetical protein